MAAVMAHHPQHFETNFIGRINDQHNKNWKRVLIRYDISLEMANVDWTPHSSPEHFISWATDT